MTRHTKSETISREEFYVDVTILLHYSSLQEISEMFDCGVTTARRWLKGISCPSNAVRRLVKRERSFYQFQYALAFIKTRLACSDAFLAVHFTVSVPTMRRWLKGDSRPHHSMLPGLFEKQNSLILEMIRIEDEEDSND